MFVRMRFSIRVCIRSERGELPLDYRQGFASLLKAALKRSEPLLYTLWYQRKEEKPFTFAVYFPQLQSSLAGDKYLKVGEQALWNFSFADIEAGVRTLNALGRLSKRMKARSSGGPRRFGYAWRKQWEFVVDRILLPPPRRPIRSSRVVFRTLSPFLVNRHGASHQYLTPAEEDFLDALQFQVRELSQRWLGRPMELDLAHCEFGHLKRLPVWHYGQYMSANKGTFILSGAPELLQLIYQAGLGVRRSQGFGMLEIVREL